MDLPNIVVLTGPPPITVVTDAAITVVPQDPATTVVVDEAVAVLVDNPITVVPNNPAIAVAVASPEVAILVVPGLPGPPGSGGGGGSSDLDTADIVATEDIPALKFVTAGGQVADSSNLAHFNHVVGISMEAVLSTFVATLATEGEVTDPSWNWTANQKLFLNGTTLSTTPPTSGFSQYVGITRNSHTVFIRLQLPILF